MAEWNIELAIVAEPYAVPTIEARWRGDTAGLVAIVSGSNDAGASLVPGERGEDYGACLWGGRAFVGVYVSPNISPEDFESKLDEIGGSSVGYVRILTGSWLRATSTQSPRTGAPRSRTRGARCWGTGLSR
ncbi:uncharacterized protein LOC113005456 [Solenopsis invicta]|uniref:uncharacterized protein LOC113005456 n=1 Tax=Solenopsis invicta TaxID=13686 RepID=UPI000E33EC82|nr:uncharacterized protein LOC113005456 [Solenopsis invicta]